MRKFIWIVIAFGFSYIVFNESGLDSHAQNEAAQSDSIIADAFKNRRSGILVQGSGQVIRILSDDVDGDRHQRFIVRLDTGQTLLIAHNIDLAARLPQLKEGDLVEFSGEYEWNDQGGVIHWTHRDPQGQHRAGWLKYEGRTYQ